jgi:predicted MPP superfamily phosphohydrolase
MITILNKILSRKVEQTENEKAMENYIIKQRKIIENLEAENMELLNELILIRYIVNNDNDSKLHIVLTHNDIIKEI